MYIIYLLILILLLVVILAFTALLRVAFVFDTERENIRLTLLWLYPFLKVTVESNASVPVLSVYCFKRKVYKRKLVSEEPGGSIGSGTGIKAADVIRAASAEGMRIEASYGFRDPFVTGIACGAAGAASVSFKMASIAQNPDFLAESDYVRLNATARVNLGNTIVNYIRNKTRSIT